MVVTTAAQAPLTGFGEDAICSCGIVDCRELGWPHEWDPAVAGDSCALLCAAGFFASEKLGVDYVRYGSGYAHVDCLEAGA